MNERGSRTRLVECLPFKENGLGSIPSVFIFMSPFNRWYLGQVIRLVMVVFCKKIGLYRKRFDSFTAHLNFNPKTVA